MQYKTYIQPTCEVTPISFLVNDNNFGNDEGLVGLSAGGAKDASLGQTNENGTFDGNESSNNSTIWEEWE